MLSGDEMSLSFIGRAFLKLLFAFSFYWLFSFPISSSFAEEEKIDQEIEKHKQTLQQMKNKWENCRSQCVSTYTHTTDQICSKSKGDIVYCTIPYTNEDCDKEYCQAEKLTHDHHKEKLDDMISAHNRHQESQKQPESNSPLEQVQKQKKDTNLLAYVGAGTTAFLAYKAAQNQACCSSRNPGCCQRAVYYGGLAVAAGIQTNKMFQKGNDLGQTAYAMCASAHDPNCPSEDGGEEEEEELKIGMPPGCEEAKLSSQECAQFIQIVNPPPEECPPDDPNYPNCENKEKDVNSPNPNMPGSDFGPGSLTGNSSEQEIREKLSHMFQPKGGWPDGKNPWVGTESFDYDKLSPSKKRYANQLMAGLNQKNKDFLNTKGLNTDAGGLDSEGSDGLGHEGSEGDLRSQGGLGSKDNSGVSASFGKESDGARALAGSEDGRAGGGQRPKSSIAQQMQAMLQKMKGKAGGAGASSGYLGDKSVLVGSDQVGVREDNIFMMVHRMNRKLDEKENRFIKSISF